MSPRSLRNRRVRRFVVLVAGVTALIQLPTVVVVSHLFARAGVPAAPLAAVGALALATVAFFVRFRPGSGDRRRSWLIRQLVELPFFVHWCASFVFLPLSIAVALVGLAVGAVTGLDARAQLDVLTIAWIACVVGAVYAVHVRRRIAVVRRLDVPIAGLPAAFDGYRIVQLSDLHVGSWTPPSWARRWVAQANAQDAQLAVVTGDLVSSGDDYLDDTARCLAELRAPDGVVVSLGNHDYFASTNDLVAACKKAGLTVLRNEGRVLEHKDAALFLTAVDDSWQGRDDIEAAIAARPKGMITILLAHDPKLWPQALTRNVALTLSGHTHGGQLGVPFGSRRWNLARFFEPFPLGLHRQGQSAMYVHAGLGTTGPPARLGVAPEIAVLTLRSG